MVWLEHQDQHCPGPTAHYLYNVIASARLLCSTVPTGTLDELLWWLWGTTLATPIGKYPKVIPGNGPVWTTGLRKQLCFNARLYLEICAFIICLRQEISRRWFTTPTPTPTPFTCQELSSLYSLCLLQALKQCPQTGLWVTSLVQLL